VHALSDFAPRTVEAAMRRNERVDILTADEMRTLRYWCAPHREIVAARAMSL